MPSPCYQCPNRYAGCHSQCDKYAAYRRKIDEAKNDWKAQSEYKDMVITAVRRVTKRKRY